MRTGYGEEPVGGAEEEEDERDGSTRSDENALEER
jgi:hypothetical protein